MQWKEHFDRGVLSFREEVRGGPRRIQPGETFLDNIRQRVDI